MLAVMQLAFVTTTSESFRQIKLWIDYHKSIGVNHFYLFVDGQVRRSFNLNRKACHYGKDGIAGLIFLSEVGMRGLCRISAQISHE